MRTRPPAVSGSFYPSEPDLLASQVRAWTEGSLPRRRSLGAIVPHAGYMYSGEVTGAVFSRLAPFRRVIILGPNHTGRGAGASLDAHDAWRTPLGAVAVDRELADRLLAACPSLARESAAHAREHSIEVELPFLQAANPEVTIVPISIGEPSLALCAEIGEACAAILQQEPQDPPLLLASSDMNHYESRETGNAKNALAYRAIERIDPEGLFAAVVAHEISMCGFLPSTALLFAARRRGVSRAEVIARADSGDRTGDTSSVVGYAGILVGEDPANPAAVA